MTREQKQVREFMLMAEQDCPKKPCLPPAEVQELRLKLIKEELKELEDAFHFSSLTEAYDAVLDLMVVVIGTGVAMGLDLEPGWHEVHRSNMSKFIDGYKRPDGKWVKGPSYRPVDLTYIIKDQSK